MRVKVSNYRAINKNTLIASFDIEEDTPWGARIIYGCKLFEKLGNKWVSFPSKETEKDGVKSYFAMVRFPSKEHHQAYEKLVISQLPKVMTPPEEGGWD